MDTYYIYIKKILIHRSVKKKNPLRRNNNGKRKFCYPWVSYSTINNFNDMLFNRELFDNTHAL